MSSQSATVRPARSSAGIIALGIVGAAAVSIALNAAVAAIALAAGASADFQPLQLSAYAMWTIVGVLAGFGGWAVVRARSAKPRQVLRTLVPAVVAISWIPDFVVGFNNSFPGTSWGAVIALMVMHVVIGAVVVAVCARVLPLPRG
ncbi:hypothetical protein HPO96_21060 [Kribbella sandramycini]|uniref:Uncharacterized protein n=1 Tax=Kribbella sandramycini TaxID=60450 RepID=A0A7Y4P247_9ACTN|nr:DUF6069 family protein [Kribbella sandramycini]MBB6566606.1 hypothetical protein [Kribbella sandramycini]NOL42739.1 hypothetical protein [Kribbella sandramycini]